MKIKISHEMGSCEIFLWYTGGDKSVSSDTSDIIKFK